MTTRNSQCSLQSDINLVEQILKQGQRLRAAMVQTILNNDPFNLDSVKTRNFKSFSETDALKRMHVINAENQERTKSLTLEDKHKVLAYLRGEKMSRNDEHKALDTFRVMSNADICDVTERSYNSDFSCCCDTCKAYYKHNLSCDFNHSSSILCKERHNNVPPLALHRNSKYGLKNKQEQQMGISNTGSRHNVENLKYVDSLKISVHSLLLNQEGNKKVYGSGVDKNMNLPTSIMHSYFIEYQIPEIITKLVLPSKSKVDSGLRSHNLVRMCSKKLHNEAIYFKQISLHDIANLNGIDLEAVNIKFQVSCRTLKQKSSNVLGYAQLNMASFVNTKHLSLNQNLPVMLNSGAPIIIGTLRVSLQLGCGQLYFGKEFIDAICSNKENIKNNIQHQNSFGGSETRHNNTEASLLKETEFCDKNYEVINRKNLSTHRDTTENTPQRSPMLDTSKELVNQNVPSQRSPNTDNTINPKKVIISDLRTHDTDKQILFGFICVGEAQYAKSKENTFITCQPFCQDDILYSRLIHHNSNPYYNFEQVLPFVYNDEFLSKLRDNYMIFEFWEKINGQDNLIGISKISLHQFYVAFRNSVITKYLYRNKLPVIGCDRWEPICNPLNGEVYGQVQILVALGADVQIHYLRRERGFESDSVIAKSPRPIVSKQAVVTSKTPKEQLNENVNLPKSKNVEVILPNKKKVSSRSKYTNPKQSAKVKHKSVDVGIQSEIKMGDLPDSSNKVNASQSSDVLGAFLTQLLQQKQKNYVENSTNTEHKQHKLEQPPPDVDNVKIRKTSDLLDSLQQALSINHVPLANTRNSRHTDTFKAHIVIENALHLPSRTKCAAKSGKGKPRFEELLPSVYVSFETSSELKVTKVVEENKNPEWDYSCDVELQADFLINNQKRLIFKVWKKALDQSPSEPNFETDTVLGFAAIDLTVLLAGMPTVSGWFNIMDFSNKCNGQIKISVTPLENLSRFTRRTRVPFSVPVQSNPSPPLDVNRIPQEIQVGKIEEPGELLSRALKRKFIELDEITQRLKSRLSHVMNDESNPSNDESDASNDELADEFEKDINTLCVEEDYDMINFENEQPTAVTQKAANALLQIHDTDFELRETSQGLLKKQVVMKDVSTTNENTGSNDNSTAAPSLSIGGQGVSNLNFVSHLDQQLIEGRQKIDCLLEKLSLLNHNDVEMFNSRYVSGCSTKQDCSNPISDDILKGIRNNADPISTDISSDNSITNLHTAFVYNKPIDVSTSSTSSNSGLLNQYAEYRLAPDGAGKTPDDTTKLLNTAASSSDT